MTAIHPPRGALSVVFVRRTLYALTVIGIVATAFELATERHWNGVEQLIPWVALIVLSVATVVAMLPSRIARVVARVLALTVLGASIYGVFDHVVANYDSGPLDQRFADTWDALPSTQQWWYAITKTVGPSPTLAPGILGQTALLLFLATLLPTRSKSQEPAQDELASRGPASTQH